MAYDDKYEQFHLNFPPGWRKRIEEAAKNQGLTMSAFIRRAIVTELERVEG